MLLLKTFIPIDTLSVIQFLPNNYFDVYHHNGRCVELNKPNNFLLTDLTKDNEIMKFDGWYMDRISTLFNMIHTTEPTLL